MPENKQVLLAKRPEGMPEESTWKFTNSEIPELEENEVLIRNHYISLDPAMRGWLNDSRSYIAPVGINEVMRAGSVGEVIKSRNPRFKEGEFYSGWGGVQHYSVSDGKGWFKIEPSLAPLPTYISTLGMPGMTAYFGLLNVGQPKKGETVLVSAAAGAVGSIVGQIAKIKGCRVVGIAGGPEKCKYIIDELGYDAAIDYKNDDLREAIKTTCPKGIDVYFDNVGGKILDAALGRISMNARIIICGAISQYNNPKDIKGPSNYLSLLVNRAKMEGFVVMDYAKDYKTAGMEMGGWMMSGKLKSKEYIVEGIENFHETFLRLFSGEKKGKLILKVI